MKTLGDSWVLQVMTDVSYVIMVWFPDLEQPLLKKDTKFKWAPEAEEAFCRFQRLMTEAPVWALPNFDDKFVIEACASNVGMGAVLMQNGHPSAFVSKAFGVKGGQLSAYERELRAIIFAVQQWRSGFHKESNIS